MAATAWVTESGKGVRWTSGSANATRVLLRPPLKNPPTTAAISATYSGGPKLVANLATAGATNVNATVPMVAATKLPIAAVAWTGPRYTK